jgi:3-isopropylmalate dehydrogenase
MIGPMATRYIAVIPGDGVGPEVAAEVLPILAWARGRGRDLAWEVWPHGASHYLATGEILPEPDFLRLRDGFDAILFGAVGDPRVPDGRHAEGLLLRLRQELALGVNLRPCRPFLDAHVPLKDVPASAIRIDVYRENTEGPYCLQGSTAEDRAEDVAVHTRPAMARLLRAAFAGARARGCGLTLAHKANVLKHGHGLWMEAFREIQGEFADVPARGMHADALLCALVQDPRPFGVIAADNLFGDLVSDLLAALQGGMGVAPSLSFAPHRPWRCAALAEPVHGSAPDLAGRGTANPTGMVLSLGMLFRHLGWDPEAELLEASVSAALHRGAATPDLGGTLGTRAMGQALREGLA